MALIPPPGSPIERAPRTDPDIDRDLREADEREFEKRLLTTTLDKALAWARSSSSAPISSSKCDGPFVGQSSRSDWRP